MSDLKQFIYVTVVLVLLAVQISQRSSYEQVSATRDSCLKTLQEETEQLNKLSSEVKVVVKDCESILASCHEKNR